MKILLFCVLSFLILSLCICSCTGRSAVVEKATEIDIPALQRSGDRLTRSITSKIERLLKKSEHPLFTEHLKSLRALMQVEWATVKLDTAADIKAAQAYIKYAQQINDGLDGDAAQWQTYASGRRPLLRGFVARHDRAFSFYQISLPADWDPEQEYPAVFYLHGYTPQPYMSWLAHYGLSGATAPASNRHYYNIGIWGRGNTSYRYAGEVDLDNAIINFQNTFKHDADRVYLTGHSMGSFGSWAYAIDRPDIWAALSIWSGADSLAPLGSGFARNIAHIPVRIWHGEKDTSVPVEMAMRMQEALRQAGNEATLVIDPEGKHMVSKDAKGPNKDWLFQFKRERPNPMHFIVAHDRYPGAWGITLRVDPAMDAHPSFTCRVDGNEVHLGTEGTSGAQINLGPLTQDEQEAKQRVKRRGPSLYQRQDLGLRGEVRVFWNKEPVYSGPAKTLTLGTGIEPLHRYIKRQKEEAAQAADKSQGR